MTQQYYSYARYTGDGQTTDFTVPFDYLAREHVRVTVNGVGFRPLWIDNATVRVRPAPVNGSLIELKRNTPSGSKEVTYYDTSQLPASVLNRDSSQMFFLIQEVEDGIRGALFGDNPGGLEGANPDTDSVVSSIAERLVEQQVYQDLKEGIETIDTTVSAVADVQTRIDEANNKARSLLGNQDDLAEASISGFLRENDSLSRLRVMNKRVGDAEAALVEESSVRATEDEAITTDLQSLQARVADAESSIVTESEARTTGDEAITTELQALQARVDDAESSIVTESEARTTADESLASDFSALQTRVGDAESSILSETEARTTADESLASDFSALQTRVGDAETSIANEANARTSADQSLASDLSTLQSRVGDAESAITDEQNTRSTEDQALAQDISNLQSSVDQNVADINAESTARAEADSSLAEQTIRLVAKGNNFNGQVTYSDQPPDSPTVDDAWIDTSGAQVAYKVWDGQAWVESSAIALEPINAAISEEQTARVEGDEALASDITTLQSTVEGNTSSIQTQATTIDGLSAQYTVKLDVNGRVVGFGLANDGTDDTSQGGSFVVRSDAFSVFDPDTDDLLFGYDAQTSTFAVNGDIVADGTVTASALDIPSVDQITTNLGVMTSGTFKTTDQATGYRVEMSDSGSYPLWYGTGSKTADNSQFYLDADGNAMYRGKLDVKSDNSGGRTEIKENVIKVFDENGALRVQIGDLSV